MRKIVYIFCLLFTSYSSYAQEWRDSLNVARSAYKAKDYLGALKYYQSAQKKAPKGINFSNEIAQAAYKAGDYKKAEEIFKKTTSTKGNKVEKVKNFHNLGNSRMKQKNYKGAIDAYKEAIRKDPTNEQTRYNLSEAIRKLKQSKDNKNKNNPKDKKDPPKNNQKNQPKSPVNPKKDNNQEEPKSNLPNKMIDRILDKLSKEEAETKRKISGKKEEEGNANSGKDW